MEVIGWILAGIFAALSIFLALRPRSGAPTAPGSGATQAGEDPGPSGREEGISDEALKGMDRYLRTAVLAPLEEALEGGDLRRPVEDAVDALRDLAFHARVAPEEAARRENLISVIQAVTREYTLETGTPVKFSGPDKPVYSILAVERFKDALFLVLANAGHFGDGQTVEVAVEQEGEAVWVRVGDRGPGFGEEALRRAFEPYWTTEPDALGMGLTQARKLLVGQGGSIRIGSTERGGGEVAISLAREP